MIFLGCVKNRSVYNYKKIILRKIFQELILLLDKKEHLRMVLPGNQEGLIRRMKEDLALLQKQYDKERKAKSK